MTTPHRFRLAHGVQPLSVHAIDRIATPASAETSKSRQIKKDLEQGDYNIDEKLSLAIERMLEREGL